MIIKFDGLDGCGKSTIIKKVAQVLRSQNYSVHTMSEFGNPDYENEKVCSSLRKILNLHNDDFDELEREVLFTLISRISNRSLITKSTADYILFDRSHLANYSYGLTINKNFETIYNFLLSENIYPKCQKVFWIDTDIYECLKRVGKRNKKSLNELKGAQFFLSVRDLFMRLCLEGACHRIDGNRPINDIVNDILPQIYQ